MAASFKKTQAKTFPRVGETATRDVSYWNNLTVPVTVKEYGAITHINFCPVSPNYLAVTCSARIQIYSPQTCQIVRTISRFKEAAHSACYRSDGRLLVAGGDEGIINVFDVNSKSSLRTFRGHNRSVQVARFLSDNIRVLSGSDDKTARIWDLSSEKQIINYKEHGDYIRTGTVSDASPDIVLTGCYDHKARLFDARMPASVLTVDHGFPIESVLMFPNGGIFMTAGGNNINVWDALAGGRLLTTLSHHHKAITSLTFCSNNQRFMSGSLDRHVKIYDVTSYQVVHTLDYPGSILSLSVAPDDTMVAVGMADGLLSMQKRKESETKIVKPVKKNSYKYQLQAKTYVVQKTDQVVQHKKREILAKYDRSLKKFDHSKALDEVLQLKVQRKHPEVTVGIMQELMRRGTIKAALAGQDSKSLCMLINFVRHNLTKSEFAVTMMDVSNIIIDIYWSTIGQNSFIDSALIGLKKTVDKELELIKLSMEVLGAMDVIFAAAHSTSTTKTNSNSSQLPSENKTIS
ncbi:hypothetical protein LOTGIDRAFT_226017 [Lottia gigantea]|uniref:U3 small nucleolar RNA-associated protein 15 homolog n=1 Tax=Lottia gigantea TaxID=225164 RepID=V4ASG7_LOTGI|nr:hypothetical protein LOTGIDRAFT_226017 [Lottia gigantea]ESP00218.1 hypothetical protein LOTGIDRAFT_226017 [Lottia gigantea]